MAASPVKRYAPANGEPPWMHLYTTNVAELASLEATLKLVMANDAALDVLTKNVSLDSIAGWARVSRMFGALVFHSNTFWFAMMRRYVYIHHGQYMLYDFKRPYLEYAKHQLPAKFRTRIQLNRCVIWCDGRSNWISRETYAYWQIQAHASVRMLFRHLDELHIPQITKIIAGNVFDERYSVVVFDTDTECGTQWKSGFVEGNNILMSDVIDGVKPSRGYDMDDIHSLFERESTVLRVNFTYHIKRVL
jgi:hypothetical protein